MARDFEVGDKVTVESFLGNQYDGKITKITPKTVYVEVQFLTPTIMKFSRFNFIGLGKDTFWEIKDLPYGEHVKFDETK